MYDTRTIDVNFENEALWLNRTDARDIEALLSLMLRFN